MRVTINIRKSGSQVIVEREPEDKRVRNESDFFYRLKDILKNVMGHDVIKKVPSKDGHMTSAPYYIRERSGKWCVFDHRHETRDISREYRETGRVCLTIEHLS